MAGPGAAGGDRTLKARLMEMDDHELNALYEAHVAEALQQGFAGWDFSFLDQRMHIAPLPWDYRELVLQRMSHASAMLDMGTGGGEFLAELGALPACTAATEAYPPNQPLARARLAPLGVQVVDVQDDGQLPFAAAAFDLVINRHESFAAAEVFRVLRPGGVFLTQQVGGKDNFELNEALQEQPYFEYHEWGLEAALDQLRAAGFEIIQQRKALPETRFDDLCAVVFYLKVVPWQIEGFDVPAYESKLKALLQKMTAEGGLKAHSDRFLVEARKR